MTTVVVSTRNFTCWRCDRTICKEEGLPKVEGGKLIITCHRCKALNTYPRQEPS